MSDSDAYRICHRDGVGRCLVAARDLEPLDVILEDTPAAVGPEEFSYENGVCVACYRQIDAAASFQCDECGFELLCSVECAKSAVHVENECAILKTLKASSLPQPTSLLPCLLCIRILLLQVRQNT